MRVALYVRVASANQLSFDAQLAYLRKYAEEHNYEVAAIFALNGVSGMKAENYLDAVLHLAETAGVKKVIARDPTRIARDALRFMDIERKFRSADIVLEYSEHPVTQPLTDVAKLLIEHFSRERNKMRSERY